MRGRGQRNSKKRGIKERGKGREEGEGKRREKEAGWEGRTGR